MSLSELWKVDFNCLLYGLSLALPAIMIVIFMSEDTALDRPMTTIEGSLVASLGCIGGIISTPLAGFAMDYLGRKRSAVISAAVGVLSWALLAFSNKVEVVLTSFFIAGVAGAIFLIVPVYVSELCEDSIRGTLTSGAVVFYGLGMLLGFIFGEFMDYKTIVYVGLTSSAVGMALLAILKESPTLLMKKGLEDEAAKAMGFYRNSKPDSKVVVQEIDKIRRSLAPESQSEVKPEEEKLTAEFAAVAPAEKLSMWQFFKKSRSTQRALALTLFLMTVCVFQGMIVVQMYAIPLFSEAIPPEVLSPNWCSALLSAVSVISGLIAAYLTDAAGRRPLFIYASIAAGVCCFGLGTQLHLHWGPGWITAVFIYFFCSAYAFGSGTVPFLLMAELFLPEVRSVMSMICLEWAWSCSFTALFLFNPLVAAVGIGPVFYFFTTVCFLTAVFAFFFLPETKGLTVDAIQLLLVKKKGQISG
ncbi:hypothetical protein ABMA28_009510 [Loxostege sticticalis]|uniref:Major facilitator superfamily (MFS) profile domain-containing protein n=1 Tax=Loxostege sticticalis TaxID=481309 RepID=A0ABD0SE62_LOXSC